MLQPCLRFCFSQKKKINLEAKPGIHAAEERMGKGLHPPLKQVGLGEGTEELKSLGTTWNQALVDVQDKK